MKSNPFSLYGKNIIITGASSGIGKSCAIICNEMGANVIIIGRDERRLMSTYSQLQNGKNLYYIQDITEYKKIEGLISDCVAKLGKIDGFIHSAGIEITLPITATTPDDFNNIFAINVISAMEFIKHLAKNKYSNNDFSTSFVLISSVMGLVGNSALSAYSASKGAILSSVKSLSVELAQKRIRINSICPGIVETEMINNLENTMSPEQVTKLKNDYLLGIGKTSDIAYACVFLLSDASRWITGTNLIVDGGYSAK